MQTVLDQSKRFLPPQKAAGVSRLAAVFVVTLLVAACGESERPLSYQPGVYGGLSDEQLDEGTRNELRDRVAQQGVL